MIPVYKNTFKQKKFNHNRCGLPSEQKLSSPGNMKGSGPYWGSYFVWNYTYSDMRGHTWASAENTINEEKFAVEQADKKSKNSLDFDNICGQYETAAGGTPDIGVFGLTIALSAAGCAPMASCRGHYSYGYHGREPQPIVMFYAKKSTAAAIFDLVSSMQAEDKDIVIINNTNLNQLSKSTHSDDMMMIIISSNSILNMMYLAQLIYNNREKF